MLGLHTHSEYSKDSFTKVEEIAQAHKDMGTDVFAITDHGTVAAFPTAFEVAKEMGMRFAPGCEIYLTPPKEIDSKYIGQQIAEHSRLARLKRIDKETKENAIKELERLRNVDSRRNFHMTLIAKSQEGLNNLFRIYSEGELYYSHRIPEEAVFKHKEGIIVLSGCLGSELCYYVKTRQFDRAEDLMKKYKDAFGENYYAEIMFHGVEDTKEKEKGYLSEKEVYFKIVELAKKVGVPLVATNDSHYCHEKDHDLHGLYRSMIYEETVSDKDASEVTGDHGTGYHIVTEEEMRQRLLSAGFDPTDVEEMIANVHKIESEIEPGIDIQRPEDLKDREQELRRRVMEGWEKKRKGTRYEQDSLDRIEKELDTIVSKNFTSYFTNMQDIVKRAHDIGLLTGPGRGSAAGSEIAYLLDITKTDPLQYGLFFERFLNPSRSEMPDIDLDIMSKKEGDDRLGSEILTDSLKDKFKFSGRINNTVTSSTLNLFKKLCSYFEIPFYLANKVTTSNTGKEMLAQKEPPTHAEFVNVIHSVTGGYDKKWDEVYRKLGICYRLDGTVFGYSIHASGVIMSEDDMVLPVDSEGVIDFNGKALEKYGYIKYDLLSVDALNAIHDLYGLDIDWEDNDDPAVWDTICRGELDFVFQLAGHVPRKMCVEGKPRSISDIAEISAINRPGPLNMNLNNIWVDIRKGKHKFEGIELTIAKILKNAFGEEHSGLLVYQEDVMRLCVDAAGFSMTDAENIRKAMGKKDEKIINSYKDQFIEGWKKNGYKDDPEEVWELLKEFSKYAFNKSHAVSYSQISYMNAKMWTYKRKEYIEWLLNNAPKKKQEVLQVARENGYKIEFPQYYNTKKLDRFVIEGNTIYAPIEYSAEFPTASDFLFSSLTKVEKGNLILAGVLDSVIKDRLGMYNIIKNIPDAKTVIPGFPSTDSIIEILDNGVVAGIWKYDPEEIPTGVVNVTVIRARSTIDVPLHLDASKIPANELSKMIKTDLSNYGVPRPGILDIYPEIDKDRAFKKYYVLRERVGSKLSGADEIEIRKLEAALKKEYTESLRHPDFMKLNKMLEDKVFTMYLTKANYYKDYGYLLLEGMFDNGTFPFYIRDKAMIEDYQSLSKGDVIRVRLKMDSYLSKRKEPVVLMKIAEILE